MSLFFVTGMPRARTAWIANYLTVPPRSICIHEGLSKFQSPTDCLDWMDSLRSTTDCVGICDSGAVYFYDAIRMLEPDAPWVVIRRAPSESEASYRAEHGLVIDLDVHAKYVDKVAKEDPTTLVVDFHDIDKEITRIARHCVPEWVHDEARHQMLATFNVQLTPRALDNGIDAVRSSGLMRHMEQI